MLLNFLFPAFIAAVFNFIPILFPFFTPGKRLVANNTILLWQVRFVSLKHVLITKKATNGCLKFIYVINCWNTNELLRRRTADSYRYQRL